MKRTIAVLGILWVGTGWAFGGPLDSARPANQGTASRPATATEEVLILTGLQAKCQEAPVVPASAESSDASPGKSEAVPAPLPQASPALPKIEPVSPRTGLGITGGAGIYLLQPRFSSNPALLTIKTVQNAGGTASRTASDSTEFNWGIDGALRAWLGLTLGDNWMIRTDYWNFRHAPEDVSLIHPIDPAGFTTTVATVGTLPFVATTLAAGAPPDSIRVSSGLRLDVFDLEGVYTTAVDRWQFQGAAGVRYVDLVQTYHATLINPGNAVALVNATFRDQQERNAFYGLGPTLAGEVSLNMPWGFFFYTDVRGSLLFGRSHQDATQQFTGGVPASQSFSASGSQDAFLPITEMELGVGWTRKLGKRLSLIAKAGFVGQVWWNAGSASLPPGGAFATIQNSSLGTSALFPITTASASNLSFIGGTATLGIQY